MSCTMTYLSEGLYEKVTLTYDGLMVRDDRRENERQRTTPNKITTKPSKVLN